MCAQDFPLETTPWFSGVNTMARAAMSLVTIHIENTTRAPACQHKPCLNWSKVSGLGTTDPVSRPDPEAWSSSARGRRYSVQSPRIEVKE